MSVNTSEAALSRGALVAGIVGTVTAGLATVTATTSPVPILITALAFLVAVALLAVLLARTGGSGTEDSGGGALR